MAGIAGARGCSSWWICDEFYLVVLLDFRNRTGYQYYSARAKIAAEVAPQTVEEAAFTGPTAGVLTVVPATLIRVYRSRTALWNYLLCALAGTTWYFQFFFYTMGETQMGRYKFSSWTLHMASIIIFSTLVGNWF